MRIVSLVPSATETLRALGVEPLACTRFYEQPELPTVGGTKNPDVDEIVALRPDLVVVNDEENRVEDADALTAAGIKLHSMSPRSVTDVGPAVNALAGAVAAKLPAPFDRWDDWISEQTASSRTSVATMIWRRPWMTMNDDTYGSSVLALLRFENVFGDDPVRYPETTLEEVAARRPDVLLLPSEPYPFKDRHETHKTKSAHADSAAARPDRCRKWGVRRRQHAGRWPLRGRIQGFGLGGDAWG